MSRLIKLFTRAAISTMFATLFASAVHADFCAPPVPTQDEEQPQQSNPPSCDDRGCRNCNASPCYAKTGVYSTFETDLEVATNGFPLTVSRAYESSYVTDGAVGYGWRSSFGARLYYATYLFAAPSTFYKEAIVVMPDGESYRYRENANGSFTSPIGRRDTLVKLADGMFQLTLQRSTVQYSFAADGALTTIKDEYGNSLRFTHDVSRRIVRVDDDSGTGRYLSITWNPSGRISSVQDNAGRVISYSYGANGTLAGVTNPAGHTTSYSYQQRRFAPLLVQVRDHWNRVLVDVTWDSLDRVATYTEDGETFSLSYQSGSTTKTHSAGAETARYDGSGLVTSHGGTTSTFTADGDLQSVSDPRGWTTGYTYLADGRVNSIAYNDGSAGVTFVYTYDATYPDRVARIEPRLSSNTSLYHGHWLGWKYIYYTPADTGAGALPGALKQIERMAFAHGTTTVLTENDPVSVYAQFSYDSKGRVIRSWNRSDGETLYSYDDAAGKMEITLPWNGNGGRTTSYYFDQLGRTTSLVDPLGNTTTYEYDNLDRVIKITLPKPSVSSTSNFVTSYTYDNSGSDLALTYTHATDANGRVTKLGQDQFGRIVEIIDTAGATTRYAYANGLLSSITDPNGNVTSYTYNAARQLQKTSFPDGTTEQYSYFADGDLQSKTDRKGVQTTYTYDIFGRRKSQTTSTKSQTLTYEGQKLTTVTDSYSGTAETTTFTYNPKTFLVESEKQGQVGSAFRGQINYTWYTSADWLQSYKVTDGGAARTPPANTYTYWSDGSVRSIAWDHATGAFFFSYDANGRQTGVSFPNGQTRNLIYDKQGRLTKFTNLFGGTNLATFNYEYDRDNDTGEFTVLGQRTKTTASVPAISSLPVTTEYFYDSNYQLVRTRNGATEKSWTYDAIGNRLTQNSTQYTYVKNAANKNTVHLSLAGNYTATHDPNGNVSTFVYVYTWDALDRLVSRDVGGTFNFKYDWQNRRVAIDYQSTKYIYRDADPVTITYTKNGAYYQADYLFGPDVDQPLSRADYYGQTYYVVDGLGSVILLTDRYGSVKNKYSYGSWGELQLASEDVVQPFGYTGREFAVMGKAPADPQYYYRGRYLDPTIGRFLSEDPLRQLDPQHIAGYEYVGNDPANATDPSGYCRVKIQAPAIQRLARVSGPGAPCPSNHPACSAYGGGLSCNCNCVGGNQWKMNVSIYVSLTMYLPNNDPNGRLFTHETRHQADMRTRFTLRCAELESEVFPNEKKCQKACRKASHGFESWLGHAGRQSNDDVHNTHPSD